MIAWIAASWACDPAALAALSGALPETAGPADVAPGLAAACPRPTAWARSLRAVSAADPPYDPFLDQQAALGQAALWSGVCAGGLFAVPSGYDAATPGDRLRLWERCGLADLGLFEPDEWLGGTGPPITAVLAAGALTRAGLPRAERERLVRALAGIPVERRKEPPPDEDRLGPVDPLAALREDAPPAVAHLAEVPWPPSTSPDARCEVRLTIVADGTPTRLDWLSCPEDLRPYVTSAVEASWFQAGRKRGQAVKSEVRLVFSPSR